jgi:hypothetical protein
MDKDGRLDKVNGKKEELIKIVMENVPHDNEIDYSDIPKLSDEQLTNMKPAGHKTLIMRDIFKKIHKEINDVNQKWGEQTYPIFDRTLMYREGGCTPKRMCEHYEIPSETRAKFLVNNSANKDELTWMHILMEEVSEACSTCDPELLEDELIQVATMAIKAIESLRKNGLHGK